MTISVTRYALRMEQREMLESNQETREVRESEPDTSEKKEWRYPLCLKE
jgi:hypothetical protein